MHIDHRNELAAIIKRNHRPLQPEPTGTASRPTHIGDIRCVLFDIYGTLFISAAGDVGTIEDHAGTQLLRDSLDAAGYECTRDPSPEEARLIRDLIRNEHARLKHDGMEFPEVVIEELWAEAIGTYAERGLIRDDGDLLQRLKLCVEYETRSNPVAPMPGLTDMLKAIRGKSVKMGIVSNAQFYTPLMFDALTGVPPEDHGFDPELCVWSFRLRQAKPSSAMFEGVLGILHLHGIHPENVLYIGNDMLKDIWTASRDGCRTALFAGDKRSLRMRENDDRCRHLQPDAIVTSMDEIPGIV